MNQFEIRANALRLRYKAARVEIQRACEKHVGHLNTAIGQVTVPEAADALRAEKERVREATRQSMAWNRLCCRQQLRLIEEEKQEYYRAHPSKRAQRRAGAE